MKIDPRKSEVAQEEKSGTEVKWMSRRSYLAALAGAGAGLAGWRWLRSRELEDGTPWPLRRVLEGNEKLARAVFDPARLSPTFPASRIDPPRLNGEIGLESDFDPETWRLRVEGLASGLPLRLTLADIQALPRTEVITELRCIEGWSLVVQWAGATLADFAARHAPAAGACYVSLATPDGGYYAGLDIESALHPQTLLCYEMNGSPLTLPHGAPLRLAVPVKYGIKHLKRIGTLAFTRERPPDYWAEQGYDYYSGH